MKRTATTLAIVCLLAVCCVALTSCNKRCRCMKNNRQFVYYTTDELSALGKTCSDMIYLEGLAAQYYAQCEWEY